MSVDGPDARPTPPLERALGWVLVALMAVSVANVLWQVFTRFALSSPSPYTEELARYLLIWIGLLGAAYAAGRGLHLAIDLVPRRLRGPTGTVVRVGVQSCVAVFAVTVFIVGGVRLVQVTLGLGQTSAALGIPLGYVYLALPVSGVLMTVFALREIRSLMRSRP